MGPAARAFTSPFVLTMWGALIFNSGCRSFVSRVHFGRPSFNVRSVCEYKGGDLFEGPLPPFKRRHKKSLSARHDGWNSSTETVDRGRASTMADRRASTRRFAQRFLRRTNPSSAEEREPREGKAHAGRLGGLVNHPTVGVALFCAKRF